MMKDYPIRHSSWPRNARGGYKVVAPPLRRKRHDGIRCYGEHVGSKCYPYDFSVHPAIPQAVFIPPWVKHVVRLALSMAVSYHEMERAA